VIKLSDEVKVSLVTAVCILALAVISKEVLHMQLDFVSQYAPLWMFIAYIIVKDKCKNPFFWSLAIILITSAILILHASF